jgi:hypothetical protein
MDIDSAVKAVKVVTEGFLDNLRTTEHTARLFHKGAEYFEFYRRQAQWSAFEEGFVFEEVYDKRLVLDFLRSPLPGKAPQHCSYPGS